MSRRKRISQKDVCEGLRRLAFGEVQDAITLLFESEENILSNLSSLDLFNVSEIKRPKGGGMEIKFFDRLKALDKLREVVEFETTGNCSSFYEALERSTSRLKSPCEDESYE